MLIFTVLSRGAGGNTHGRAGLRAEHMLVDSTRLCELLWYARDNNQAWCVEQDGA